MFPAVGNTSDRDPEVDLKSIRQLADRTFRELGLDGLYIIEMQGIGNYPREGKGRTLMTHIHAITWSAVPIDIPTIGGTLCRKDAWCGVFDADPFDIRTVTDEPGELYYVTNYMLKAPSDVKMLEQRAKGPRTKSTEKGLKPEFAARHLEFLSQVEIGDIIRSVGKGKDIRSFAMRRLKAWHKSRERWERGRYPAFVHEELWSIYRKKKKKVQYAPFIIRR